MLSRNHLSFSETRCHDVGIKITTQKVSTEEFKPPRGNPAVRLANERENLCAVAKDIGVHESVLGRWRRTIGAESSALPAQKATRPPVTFPGKGNPCDEELVKLQKENRRFKEENESLKKAMGIFNVVARSPIQVPRY